MPDYAFLQGFLVLLLSFGLQKLMIENPSDALASLCEAASKRGDTSELVEFLVKQSEIEAAKSFLLESEQSEEDAAKAKATLDEVHTKVMETLKEESEKLQKQYKTENAAFDQKFEKIKDELDADFRASLEGRIKPTRRETMEGRRLEVEKLAKQYYEEYMKQAEEAMERARKAQEDAKKAKELATAKQTIAIKAKAKLEDAIALEKQRRTQASQDINSARVAHEEAAKLAVDMAGNGTFDIGRLQEAVAGGAYVWVWAEDTGRFDSHPEETRKHGATNNPVILYEQRIWKTLEAHFLALQAGASVAEFGRLQISVSKKLFAQDTGFNYSVDVNTLKQKNLQTGYERGISRLYAGKLDEQTKSQLLQQRNKALEEAEIALLEARKAWRSADFEEQKAAHLVERAEERVRGADITAWIVSYPNGSLVGRDQVAMNWTAMNDTLFTEELVDPTSAEYQSIVSYFSKTSSNRIISIVRIQNILLWHLFARTRELVANTTLNNGNPNEEFFWHGSGRGVEGALEKMVVGGFDSDFGRAIPKGIWLATTSEYSLGLSPTYGNVKKIFLVRTVLGYVGQIHGTSTLEKINGVEVDSHHCGNTTRGHVRRDDQWGGGSDKRYVVNRNNQVYPAYILEFQ